MDKNGYTYTRGSYKVEPCSNVVNFSDYIAFSQSNSNQIHADSKVEASIINFSEHRGN